MSAMFWQPGAIYAPGSLVRATGEPAAPAPQGIANPGFESGATGWTLTGALVAASVPGAFSGSGVLRLVGPAANSSALTVTAFPVTPGQSVSCTCMINVSNARDQVGGAVVIVWLDAGGATLGFTEGNQVNVRNAGWSTSTVNAVAPANAASCRFGVFAFALQSGTLMVDAFSSNYAPPPNQRRLVFRAVQPAVGTSAATEPVWPPTVGAQVVDGTVTWEAIEANIVAWSAEPILRNGTTEPVWPITPGQNVTIDGIVWTCIGRQVKDARCPHSTAVAIGATKVFAADGDVVRYSASGNPLDWSAQDDAGFLPTGLQQNGANNIDVLNLYRSNLVAFNSSTFQMWQIDPDPEQMALLDAIEGIGSVAQGAAQPVGNDLFFLTALGVRTVGIAAGSTNLQAGDVGMPIDPLVQGSVAAAAASGVSPHSCYYPAGGQYWLMLPSQFVPPALPTLTIEGPIVCPAGGLPVSIQYSTLGGVPPFVWSLHNAPAGWAISAHGLVTGTAVNGLHSWTVRVNDGAGQVANLTRSCDGTIFLTSLTYPLEVIESMNVAGAITAGQLLAGYIEGLDVTGAITGGELRSLLQAYTRYQPEGLDVTGAVTGGELRQILITYDRYQPEGLDVTGAITGGELRQILITYGRYQPEGLDVTGAITGGTLS